MLIQAGEWRPDLPAFESGYAQEALNVIPRHTSYGPVGALLEVGGALTARCRGAYTARAIDGTVSNFAGDATKLYRYNATTLVWDDVSRLAGGAYSVASDGFWQFSVFGDILIAVNGIDAPQAFTLTSSSNFAALGGSPPLGGVTATIGNFAVLARVNAAENRIRWSAINDAADWTIAAATQCDQQDLPTGGRIMGVVGYEGGGVVFQERSVRLMTYIGSPEIFRIDVIANVTGTPTEGSIASYESMVFYQSHEGFVMIEDGRPTRIGDGKVDRYFLDLLDQDNRFRVTSAIDHKNKLYVIGFPGTSDSGTPGQILFYHWPSGKWTRAEVSHDLIYSGMTTSALTLDSTPDDSMDDDTLHGLDSVLWSGAGRFVLAAFTTNFKFATFEGANLAATVDTFEAEIIPGKRARINSLRPMVDGGTPTLAIGVRNRQIDSVSLGSDITVNGYGAVVVRADGRYLRARLKVPSASTWTHILGVDDIRANVVGGR